MVKKQKEKNKFPTNFFTQKRPHIDQQEKDMIPFQWSPSVLTGKSEVKIVSLNKKKSSRGK